jgi:GTP-binding protein
MTIRPATSAFANPYLILTPLSERQPSFNGMSFTNLAILSQFFRGVLRRASLHTVSALHNPFQQASFLVTVNDLRDLPAPLGREIAFVGRSNAGKSSAINALANHNRLAFVSKTPGRTQHINFFDLGANRYLVDLPGYGFASAPGNIREHWEALVASYLLSRESLAGLVLIMDARHPLKPRDRQMLEWFSPSGKPIHILLTKADKLSRGSALQVLREVRLALGKMPGMHSAQLFSSLTREGLDEAIKIIWGLLIGSAPDTAIANERSEQQGLNQVEKQKPPVKEKTGGKLP